jgi:hypothetical protein
MLDKIWTQSLACSIWLLPQISPSGTIKLINTYTAVNYTEDEINYFYMFFWNISQFNTCFLQYKKLWLVLRGQLFLPRKNGLLIQVTTITNLLHEYWVIANQRPWACSIGYFTLRQIQSTLSMQSPLLSSHLYIVLPLKISFEFNLF